MRNRSTLAATDADAVRAALLGEFGARGLRVGSFEADAADAAASATITLSENAQGFLWVAEIRQGDRSSVMLMAVPRAAASPAAASGITLRSALLWSGPERLLAAAPLPAALPSTTPAAPPPAISPSTTATASGVESSSVAVGAPDLLLLDTDGVTAILTDSQRTFMIALPPPANIDRDPRGSLAWNANTLTVTVSDETCTVSAPLATAQPQCHADDKPTPAPAPVAQLGSQRVDLPPACGEASGEILAAGTGDYTQPDSVRAYEMRDGAAAPISPAVEFPGPVMVLEAESSPAALAVVRNLATGDDEVYEISLVCGR